MNNKLKIIDHNSTYGTFLSGAKLQPNVPVELKAGNSFYLGDPLERDLTWARSANDWLSLMRTRIETRVPDDHDNLSAVVVMCRVS